MRKLLIAICILIVIAVTAYLYLRNNKLRDFEPDIKQKLDQLVQEASHGLYHLQIDTLDTDVINRKIVLTKAHLWPDTSVYAQMEKEQQAPNDLFDVRVSQLLINDIEPANFLKNREIILRRLFINQPVITVYHKKQPYLLAEDSSRTVFQQIQKDLKNIKVDSIVLNDIDLVYKNVLKKKEQRLLNIAFFMEDFLIDSATQFDKQRFLFAKRAVIALKDYHYNTPDSLYRFSASDIRVETNKSSMEVRKVRFQPRVSIRNFYKALKHQQDHFDVMIDQLQLSKIDWWSFLGEESFYAGNMELNGGNIRVYNDRSMPEDKRSKVGKYPQQLLMKLPFELKVPTVSIRNIDVSYEEKNPATNQTGTLYFKNIYATIRNLTNIRDEVKRNPYLKITAKGRFMKESAMTATFALDLARFKEGRFSLAASMGGVSAATLNKITRPLAMVEIKSLNLKSVSLSVRGDNRQATSSIKILYDGLQINALKEEDHKLKKRGLLSFIANHFVIKTANPANGKEPRVETGSFTRVPNRSFFNLIWKATFVAAGKTVGFKAK